MSLSDNLGVNGAGRPITLDGKVHYVCKITQGQKEEFCSWYLGRVKKQTYEAGADMRGMARAVWDEVATLQESLARIPGEKHREYMQLENKIQDRSIEARSLEQQAADQVKELNKDIAMAKYEWEGECINDALNTVTGGYRITWILLREKQPSITEQEVVNFYGHGKKKAQAKDLHDIVQWALGFEDFEPKKPDQPEASSATS